MAGYRVQRAGYRKRWRIASKLKPTNETGADVLPGNEPRAAFIDCDNTAFDLFTPSLFGVEIGLNIRAVEERVGKRHSLFRRQFERFVKKLGSFAWHADN